MLERLVIYKYPITLKRHVAAGMLAGMFGRR
jgi:hypothetical protein